MNRKDARITGLLTLVSLGFYGIHWFAQKQQALEQSNQRVPSLWLVVAGFCLLPIDFLVSLGLQTHFIEKASLIRTISIWAVVGILLVIAGLYGRWALAYNRALARASSGMLSSKLVALPFGLGCVGFMSLQSKLNSLLAQGMAALPNQATSRPIDSTIVIDQSVSAPVMDVQAAAQPVSTGDDWQQGIATIQPGIGSDSDELAPAVFTPTIIPPLTEAATVFPTEPPEPPPNPIIASPIPEDKPPETVDPLQDQSEVIAVIRHEEPPAPQPPS